MKKRLNKANKSYSRGGYIVISVIAFSAIFALLIFSLVGFIFTQSKVGRHKELGNESFQIAEAGLNYYKWFLAHNPNDLQNGTGQPGPYEQNVSDPEGGDVGTFELTIEGNQNCGVTTSIDITSEGWSSRDSSVTKTVFGRYALPSVAQYSFIINSNVWAGSDRNIKGRYHSNGGIRMDGANDSLVTSAVEDWECSSTFGCNPTQTQPGVFGGGSGSEFWEFPVPQVDFVGIGVDLGNLKDIARNNGIYLSPTGGQSSQRGYHLIFKSDGSVDIYKVSRTNSAWSIHIDDIGGGWQRDYHTIRTESFVENRQLPADCGLIFVEDKLWVEGVVKGKITVAAAKINQVNFNSDIIINGNIDYTTGDGSDGLTLIAENSILIPLEVPNDLSIKGIMVAQGGYFGRNLYPCWYSPYDKRGTLSMDGSIVSNGRVGTKWGYSGSGCGSGQWSGFDTRVNSYDRKLATDPPPFTPYVSGEYTFVEWREEK